MKNKIVLAALLASRVLFSQAATLPDNIMEFDTVMTRPCAMTLANPALSPLRHSVSLSSVAAGYTGSMLRQPAVSANGHGQRYGFFDASAYLRGSSSAITGHASYRNGRIYGITGTETLSPALIYPFFTVDEKGGDMNCETYSFGGSYASSVASKWMWGAQLDYTATQAFRSTDPRPKDTEGRLSLAAGIGYRLGSVILAVGADVMKYRQSNSIMFVSELGEIKIYQAGGLGTHYVRFAGSSKSADFSGLNRAVSLSMATDRASGPFASLRYGRFTLSKDLADMNNLRLNHIGENSCNAQAGWRSPRLAASVALSASRRIGSDNIFGEAIGSVYPLIATYATFRRNTFSSGGMISARPLAGSRSHIDLSARAFYNYTADRCLDPAQPRIAMIRNVNMALSAAWTAMAGRRIVLCAGASAAWRMPLSSRMEGIQSDFFLDRLAMADFAFASRHRVDATISASADYIMPRFCALGLRASYTRLWHAMANNGNAFEAAVCVKF